MWVTVIEMTLFHRPGIFLFPESLAKVKFKTFLNNWKCDFEKAQKNICWTSSELKKWPQLRRDSEGHFLLALSFVYQIKNEMGRATGTKGKIKNAHKTSVGNNKWKRTPGNIRVDNIKMNSKGAEFEAADYIKSGEC